MKNFKIEKNGNVKFDVKSDNVKYYRIGFAVGTISIFCAIAYSTYKFLEERF